MVIFLILNFTTKVFKYHSTYIHLFIKVCIDFGCLNIIHNWFHEFAETSPICSLVMCCPICYLSTYPVYCFSNFINIVHNFLFIFFKCKSQNSIDEGFYSFDGLLWSDKIHSCKNSFDLRRKWNQFLNRLSYLYFSFPNVNSPMLKVNAGKGRKFNRKWSYSAIFQNLNMSY